MGRQYLPPDVGESRLKQVCSVFPQEYHVAYVGIWHLCGIEQWRLDDVHLNKLVHSRKQYTLKLESALMISISQDEENVLNNAEEILLEEGVGNSWVGSTGKIVDHLQAYYKQC